jgi:hypothetical protein
MINVTNTTRGNDEILITRSARQNGDEGKDQAGHLKHLACPTIESSS